MNKHKYEWAGNVHKLNRAVNDVRLVKREEARKNKAEEEEPTEAEVKARYVEIAGQIIEVTTDEVAE